jgi:hypothetical protein
MRKEKELIEMLRGLVKLIADESTQNQKFADKLEILLSELPEKKNKPKKTKSKLSREKLPDIHAELNARGETEFRLWLRDQPVPVLRALISAEDFDATRRTTKWKEPEKLADYIADRLQERQARGSAFLGRKAGQRPE